jgi:hypothetical protein
MDEDTKGDIKVMLPREWDPLLLQAQADVGERSLAAYVRGLVEEDLRRRGLLDGAAAAVGA